MTFCLTYWPARSTCGQYFWVAPAKGEARDEIAFTGVLHRILHRTTGQDALLRYAILSIKLPNIDSIIA